MLTPKDAGWNLHVMGQFTSDELIEGKPSVDGLRRVCELLVGDIVKSLSVITHFDPVNYIFSAKHLLQIERPDGKIIEYQDVADVSVSNTHKDFQKYPTAIAATRAEGRALRKALKLRKVICAEEASTTSQQHIDEAVKINSGMFDGMNIVAKDANVNIPKLIKKYQDKYRIKNPINFTQEIGSEILAKLHEYRANKKSVPAELSGYCEFKLS